MKHVVRVDEIPKDAHYCVVKEKYSEVDDNYGSYTQIRFLDYIYFYSEEDLKSWIIQQTDSSIYKVLSVTPLSIERKVEIKITGDLSGKDNISKGQKGK